MKVRAAQMDYLPPNDPDGGHWRSAVRSALARIEPLRIVRRMLDGGSSDAAELVRFEREIGLFELLVPEQFGGPGASMDEVVIAFEELGRALHPGPYLDSALALRVLSQVAGTELLAEALKGEHLGLSLDAGPSVTAVQDEGGWLLTGVRELETGLDGTDRLILVRAESPDDALFVVRSSGSGYQIETGPTVDPSSPSSRLQLRRTPADLLVKGPEVQRVVSEIVADGALLVAADAVGGAKACLDRAVQYSLLREQFGRPIGQFQAVKHQCAEMLVLVEGARLAVQAAASLLETDRGSAAAQEAVSIAKAAASDAYYACAMMSLHIFGGRGFLWSDDAHLYLRRALKDSVRYGGPAHHRWILSGLLGASGRGSAEVDAA